LDDIIEITEQRVAHELKGRGIVSADRTEREVIVQKGRVAGCVIRCFFKDEAQAVFAFGESVIEALSGFGSVIHRLSGDGKEDEVVLEVSFKF